MKRYWTRFLMLLGLSAVVMLTSCYPDSDVTYSQTDIVITLKDDTVDFSKIMTYYLPDKVFIADTTEDDEPIENEQLILNQIEKNLNDYGYTRVTDTTDAENTIDVVIIPTVFKSTVTSIWYPYYPYYPGWDWWWGPGWGYYPPGWGYYPPSYYPPYVSQFTMGSLKIDMLDPWKPVETPSDTGNIKTYPTYWMGGVQGLLQGSNVPDRIKSSIDQIFKQSPYLKHE